MSGICSVDLGVDQADLLRVFYPDWVHGEGEVVVDNSYDFERVKVNQAFFTFFLADES